MSGQPDFSINSLFSVKGKVALVTGGGAGIGKMMAAALVQNGAKVYIASRKLQVVEETARELTAVGPGQCIALQADLQGRAQAEALAAQIAARETKLHILINNSGMSWGSPLENFDEKNGWDRLMALNVKAMFYMTAALMPLLRAGANGNADPARVINIRLVPTPSRAREPSSVASVQTLSEGPLSGPDNGTWSYSASKAAVNQLSRTMASTLSKQVHEPQSDFISVNVIAPGVFPSRMTKYGIEKAGELMAADQPMGRIGIPEDLAGLTLFLSSRASSHLTGTVIPIDGGQSLGVSGLARL
ncbi:hypothetical protein HK105_200380 [Polyrhizophydium stewartii]|uniref:Uncharacterized protein n=1 Tax=Polyrhizophydium stewartii TaxID=2732419 RepID=A0ABR4NLC4_9FUNG